MQPYKLLLLAVLILLTAHAIAKDNPKDNSLFFISNAGQITDQHNTPRTDIDFKLCANGVSLFVGDGQLHYQWINSQNSKAKNEKKVGKDNDLPADSISTYRMDVTLVGANKNAALITEETTPYYEHYYTKATPDGVKALSYSKITYKNIYPNIDWVLYTQNGALKYDFVVHKGGNIADIKLKYEGATQLKLTDGELTAKTPYGQVTEHAPFTYNTKTKETIASQYILEQNILTFDIAPTNAESITIDPTLAWATYLGGGFGSYDSYSETDTAGNVYILMNSIHELYYNNIITSGTYMSTLTSNITHWMVLAKFDKNGNRLWGTYYPIYTYWNYSFDINKEGGDVYIASSTNDTGLATTGSYQDTLSWYKYSSFTNYNSYDGLITKFNTNGARVWSTYYGGKGDEHIYDIIYRNNSIYICGELMTNGDTLNNTCIVSDNLATPGVHQDTLSYLFANVNNCPMQQGILAKFNDNGNRIWCTYYPIPIERISCDINDNVYSITNTYTSHSVPFYVYIDSLRLSTTVTTTSTPTIIDTGSKISYFIISKFNSNGTKAWGTYFDGRGADHATDIANDAYGNTYIVGNTNSDSLIATNGAYQTTPSGSTDVFLLRLNPNGIRQWSTYYGGSSIDIATSIKVLNGYVYIYGGTTSLNNIATANAHKTTIQASDAFFAKFSTAGQRVYSSYFGGNNDDNYSIYWGSNGRLSYNSDYDNQLHYLHMRHHTISINYTNGDIYLSGSTTSTTGLATQGAFQYNLDNRFNSFSYFLAKFEADTGVYIEHPILDTVLCNGDTLHINYGVTKTMRSNNVFTLQLSNASGSFSAGTTTLATTNGTTAGGLSWVVPPTVTSSNNYKVRILSSAPADTSGDIGFDLKIASYPANFSAAINSPICSGDTLSLTSNSTTANTTYSWVGANGFATTAADTNIINADTSLTGTYYITATNAHCSLHDTLNAIVSLTPAKPILNSNTPLCGGDTLLLYSSTPTQGVTYAWTGQGFSSTLQNPILLNAQPANSGTYTLTVSLGNCSNKDTINIQVDPAAEVTVIPTPGSDVCTGQSVSFVAFVNNAGTTPAFQWQRNGVDIPGATNTSYVTTPTNGDAYRVILTPATSCKNNKISNTINMTVLPILTPSVTINANPTPPVAPWTLVTFTATPINGGVNPTYQWKRNGQDVVGATNDTWGTYQLSDGDVVSVILYSTYQCADPDSAVSNAINIQLNLGVDDLTAGSLQLYPNPNNGSFTLKGNVANNKPIDLTIINKLGQLVYQTTIQPQNNTINQQININKELATGIYLLQLKTEDAHSNVKLHIQ